MTFAFARQLFIAVILALVAVAYVQVSAAPAQSTAQVSFRWDTVVSDSTAQVKEYVGGIRGEVDWWRGTYDRVTTNIAELRAQLTVEAIENAGE